MSRDAPDTEVDGLFEIAKAINRVAEAIKIQTASGKDLHDQLLGRLDPCMQQLIRILESKL
jgi:hypothetical protein